MIESIRVDGQGRARCWWPGETPDYVAYHDDEWGRPVVDDRRLLEKLALEGFQSGLSWITILRKRENFRRAFAGFDPAVVAQFGARGRRSSAGRRRHRAPSRQDRATINNAQRCGDLIDEFGSLAAYIWTFEPTDREPADAPLPLPSQTPDSLRLSKDLKRRGWRFVGPTTVYAFMQAMGWSTTTPPDASGGRSAPPNAPPLPFPLVPYFRFCWRFTGADSVGERNELGEPLRWCHPLEGLSRSVVEAVGDVVEVGFAVDAEVGAFGHVLAEESVGVFVGASLPR